MKSLLNYFLFDNRLFYCLFDHTQKNLLKCIKTFILFLQLEKHQTYWKVSLTWPPMPLTRSLCNVPSPWETPREPSLGTRMTRNSKLARGLTQVTLVMWLPVWLANQSSVMRDGTELKLRINWDECSRSANSQSTVSFPHLVCAGFTNTEASNMSL